MTVRELIELNQMITDVEIDIRQNGSLRIDQLNIGCSQGEKPPYPTRVPRKPEYAGGYNLHNDHYYREATYLPKSINSWDDGKDYWQVKVNRIPKKWLDLEVFSWEVWPASAVCYTSPRRSEGVFKNVNFHGQRINIIALPSGEHMEIPELKQKHADPDDQLEGQMSIEDFMEGE